jgi:hypothetical protein
MTMAGQREQRGCGDRVCGAVSGAGSWLLGVVGQGVQEPGEHVLEGRDTDGCAGCAGDGGELRAAVTHRGEDVGQRYVAGQVGKGAGRQRVAWWVAVERVENVQVSAQLSGQVSPYG